MCSGFRRMFMYSNLLALKEMETSTPWADAYRIAFIGKNVCHKKENSCITDTDGFAVAEERVALVSSTQNSTFKETLTLIHEFGHFFGAIDHYLEQDDNLSDSMYSEESAKKAFNDLGFASMCIFGSDKKYLDSISVCVGCDNLLKSGFAEQLGGS